MRQSSWTNAAPRAGFAGAATACTGSPRVLVRDDDADFAAEMMQALRARGFVPFLLGGQRTLEDAFRLALPEIVLLDICAPRPDGFEILRFLRDYDQERAIPVFLISGAADAMVRAATMLCATYRLPLGGVFRKPVGMPALVAALLVALERR